MRTLDDVVIDLAERVAALERAHARIVPATVTVLGPPVQVSTDGGVNSQVVDCGFSVALDQQVKIAVSQQLDRPVVVSPRS